MSQQAEIPHGPAAPPELGCFKGAQHRVTIPGECEPSVPSPHSTPRSTRLVIQPDKGLQVVNSVTNPGNEALRGEGETPKCQPQLFQHQTVMWVCQTVQDCQELPAAALCPVLGGFQSTSSPACGSWADGAPGGETPWNVKTSQVPYLQ